MLTPRTVRLASGAGPIRTIWPVRKSVLFEMRPLLRRGLFLAGAFYVCWLSGPAKMEDKRPYAVAMPSSTSFPRTSPTIRRSARGTLVFCNQSADKNVRRLTSNPFDSIAKANEKADPRRQRRAMTESESTRLLAVARERPLLDSLTTFPCATTWRTTYGSGCPIS